MTLTDQRKLDLGSGTFLAYLPHKNQSNLYVDLLGPAIPVENVTAVSRRYVQNIRHCQMLISRAPRLVRPSGSLFPRMRRYTRSILGMRLTTFSVRGSQGA